MNKIASGLFFSVFLIIAGFVIYESLKENKPTVRVEKTTQISNPVIILEDHNHLVDTPSKEITKLSDLNIVIPSPELRNRPSRIYSYSISGFGDSGYVWGDAEVDRDGGYGVVFDEDGNEIHISLEWTGHGTLEGYGDDGSYYELETF